MRRQRSIPRVAFAIAGALLLARFGLDAHAARRAREDRATLAPRVRTIAEALAASRESGRPLLIEFTADWCAPCARFDDQTLRDGAVRQTLRDHFEFVRLMNSRDPSRSTPGEAAARERHGVTSFPTFVVISPRLGSAQVTAGFLGPRDFQRLLEGARLRELAAASRERRGQARPRGAPLSAARPQPNGDHGRSAGH